MPDALSRRSFVASSGSGFASAWVALHLPAILGACRDARRAAEEGSPFRLLTAEEAADVEAIATTILPSEPDGLGAREAGAVHFIDRALDTFRADRAPAFREGLDAFRAEVRERFPGVAGFAALDAESRDGFLRSIEDGPFFGEVWFLTVLGTFADPSYGGNRDGIGWRLIGFEDRHVWQPPFGWYDREAHGG